MSIYVNHVFFNCVDSPQRKIYSDGSTLYLDLKEKREKAYIDFRIRFGDSTKENATELRRSLDLLAKNSRGGLFALLRYSSEPDQILSRKNPIADRFVSGFDGCFKSVLEIKNGRILYYITLYGTYCKGTAFFDLGVAMKNRLNLMKAMIEGFEMNYLSTFIEKVIQRNAEDEKATKEAVEYIYQE